MSVLVYLQNIDAKLTKKNFEVASYASQLAELMKSHAIAVIFGSIDENELSKIANYGIRKTLKVSLNNEEFVAENQLHKIEEIVASESIKAIVFPDTSEGKILGSKLSSKLNSGIVTAVEELPQSIEPFIICKNIFSGKVYAKVKMKSKIKILTLAVNSYGAHENKVENVLETIDLENEKVPPDFKILERKIKATGGVPLLDADFVVSGGRGLQSPDNWHVVEDLARQLGAATACSRPVSDDGWRPHEEHVGQTGKLIAPNLYIAVGISGATQHIAGVNRSKCIVAVNTDADAPIFEAADYGIVGDAMQVLPKLTAAFKVFMES